MTTSDHHFRHYLVYFFTFYLFTAAIIEDTSFIERCILYGCNICIRLASNINILLLFTVLRFAIAIRNKNIDDFTPQQTNYSKSYHCLYKNNCLKIYRGLCFFTTATPRGAARDGLAKHFQDQDLPQIQERVGSGLPHAS